MSENSGGVELCNDNYNKNGKESGYRSTHSSVQSQGKWGENITRIRCCEKVNYSHFNLHHLIVAPCIIKVCLICPLLIYKAFSPLRISTKTSISLELGK